MLEFGAPAKKLVWVIERDLPFDTVHEHRAPIAVPKATEDEPPTP
jgi:hypothetical protein